jgi:hypothetical protein
VGWHQPSDDGFSSVLGYKLYWNGGGSGNIIDTPIYDTMSDSILEYTLNAPDIQAGLEYSFAVAAYNSVFESSPSNIVKIIAALVPSKPDPPVRTGSARTAVTFSWNAPHDGGVPITSYIVQSN